jgi:hypothetical protein
MTHFAAWYAKNGQAYNRKRAERLATDPEYAQRVKAQRAARKAKLPPINPINGINVSKACEALDVPVWKFNNWKAKGWIPKLLKKSGALWLHSDNLGLLAEFNRQLSAGANGHELADWLFVNWIVLET